MRIIDGNELYNIEKLMDTEVIQKSPTASWLLSQVLHDIQASPEIDLETLPVVKQLRAELEKVKKERDAAIRDIPKTCKTCRYGNSPCDWCQYDPDGELNWEWRGVKED